MLSSNLPDHLRLPSPHNEYAHVVQFYTDDDFLLDGVAGFIGDSLEAGESAISVATQPHTGGLLKRLLARGLDVNRAVSERRYIFCDAEQLLSKFLMAGMPDRRRFQILVGSLIRQAERAAEVPNKRVAIFGEMVALLWVKKRFDAALQLERLWNDLARTHFFYLRCGYPVRAGDDQLKGEPYATICAEHSIVIPSEAM